MFQKKQTASDLQKVQEVNNTILEEGKQLGLDTHPTVESDTDDATVMQQCQNEV